MSGSSKRKPKRKAAVKTTWRRKRPNKVEIYLSDEELEKFRAKCAAKSRSYSEQLRFWVNLEARPRKASEPPAPDPRQTSIEALTQNDNAALRAWAERNPEEAAHAFGGRTLEEVTS